jgi:hypothetical protein
MSTDSGYRRKDNLRSCSICGVRWHFSEMRYIGQNRWACPDDKEGLTAEQISAHNAKVKPLLVKQFKRPLITGEVPDYHFQEGVLFNLVCQYATQAATMELSGAIDSVASVQSVPQCAIYLSEIIRENLRPPSWIAQATTALRACAVFLRSKQSGPPGSGGGTTTIANQAWGAFGIQSASIVAKCTLALIRAWQVFGDDTFLVGFKAGLDYIRQVLQRTDAINLGAQTSPAGVNSRVYLGGGFAEAVSNGNFFLSGALCMWPLAEAKAILGGSYVLGATVTGGAWDLVPAGTIDQTLTDARKFYVTGTTSGFSVAPGSGTFIPTLAPLSTTTPRSFYTSAIGGNSPAGAGQWHLRSYTLPSPGATEGRILSNDIASAIRGLFEYEGYSSTVAALYEWLQSIVSLPANEPPAGTPKEVIRSGSLGVYDPTVAIPAGIGVLASVNALPYPSSTGSYQYDLPMTGLLSPVRVASGRDTANFKASFARPLLSQAKTGLGRTTARADVNGATGFSFQALSGQVILGNAAQYGLSYRYAPKMALTVKAG